MQRRRLRVGPASVALAIVVGALLACEVDKGMSRGNQELVRGLNSALKPTCAPKCERPCSGHVVIGGMLELECRGVGLVHKAKAQQALSAQCGRLTKAGVKQVRLDWQDPAGKLEMFWAHDVDKGDCNLRRGLGMR